MPRETRLHDQPEGGWGGVECKGKYGGKSQSLVRGHVNQGMVGHRGGRGL